MKNQTSIVLYRAMSVFNPGKAQQLSVMTYVMEQRFTFKDSKPDVSRYDRFQQARSTIPNNTPDWLIT